MAGAWRQEGPKVDASLALQEDAGFQIRGREKKTPASNRMRGFLQSRIHNLHFTPLSMRIL
jgi:hypothetical protein